MEHIRWMAGAGEARGAVVMGVLALQMSGVMTLATLREIRERIKSLSGVAATVLDFRRAVLALGEEGLHQFASEGPSRQPMALLVDPIQEESVARYCAAIAPRFGKVRVLFTDEAAALAWAARRAQVWTAPAPVVAPATASVPL